MDAKAELMKAEWIWPEPYHLLRNTYAQFRADFILAARPRRAPLAVSADQMYMLYINGVYVMRGPARGYQASWPFDEIDVAAWLKPGKNWISIRAYNAGVSTFQYLHQRAAGVICALRVGSTTLRTGQGWWMRVDPACRRDTGRLSMQLNFQEWVDARLDDEDWLYASRFSRQGWIQVRHGKPFGSMPWHDMEPRGIPNLSATVVPYRSLRARSHGRSLHDGQHGFAIHEELHCLEWQPIAGGRATGDRFRFVISPAAKGAFSAVVVDMGTQTVGTLLVEAATASGGEILDFYFTQIVDDQNKPVTNPAGVACDAAMAARLVLREGRTRHEFFQPIGHRYVVVIARGLTQPLNVRLAVRKTVYPLAIKGRFVSDDEDLNQIYRICRNTQQICMLDAYVDTPWREQAQWWGDARVQAQNSAYLANDVCLLRRGIDIMARQEVPNGLTYGHAPTIAHECILPDFSILWAVSLWDYCWQTGDASLFVRYWPRVQRLLSYFCTEGRGANGLLAADRRYWHFLDWADLQRTGTPALLNLWYLYMLQKLEELARVCRASDALRQLGPMLHKHRRLVQSAFYDRDRRLFCDGLDERGRRNSVCSVHTQVLAILCGLMPREHQHMIEAVILPHVTGQPAEGAVPSIYWRTYVYQVLQTAGYGAAVVEDIRRRWKPMIGDEGTWSQEKGDLVTRSCSHAWSAHPLYHLVNTLGGIMQAAPAWREVAIRPTLDAQSINKVNVTVPTPQGLVRSAWQRRGTRISGSIVLPPGMTGKLILPSQPTRAVSGKCGWNLSLVGK